MSRFKSGFTSSALTVLILSAPGPDAYAFQHPIANSAGSGELDAAVRDSCKTVSAVANQSYSIEVKNSPKPNMQLYLEYKTKGIQFLHGAPKRVNSNRAVGGQFYRSNTTITKISEPLPQLPYVNLEFLHYPEFVHDYEICGLRLSYREIKEPLGSYDKGQFHFATAKNDWLAIKSVDSFENLIDIPQVTVPSKYQNPQSSTNSSSNISDQVQAFRIKNRLFITGTTNNSGLNSLALNGGQYRVNTGFVETIVEDVATFNFIPASIITGHDQITSLNIPISDQSTSTWQHLIPRSKLSSLLSDQENDFTHYRLSSITEEIVKHRRLLEAELPPLTAGMKLVYPEPWSGVELEIDSRDPAKQKSEIELEMIFTTDVLDGQEDIGIYHYQEDKSEWVQVASNNTSDTNLQSSTLKAIVDRSGKYIAATIEAPDSPEGVAYTPNYFTERDPASPADNINVIAPPAANQNGDAALNYTFTLPPGRRNMQPDLALTYNSSGASSWVGLGWDLNLSAISIDTRWGYPLYHPECESETYQIDGKQLWPSANRLSPNQLDGGNFLRRNNGTTINNTLCENIEPIGTSFQTVHPGYRLFKLRVDDRFIEARRYGSTPSNYFWVVKLPNGHTRYYGRVPELFETQFAANREVTSWYGEPDPLANCEPHLLSDPLVYRNRPVAVAEWPLVLEEDELGNSVVYCHQIENSTTPSIEPVNARNLYLARVFYTGLVKRSTSGKTIVTDAGKTSVDPTINVVHRLGPYTVELESTNKNDLQSFSSCDAVQPCFEQRYSANLGLARSESHLLTSVAVKFRDNDSGTPNNFPISKWNLQYQPGDARKPLLTTLVRERPSTTTTAATDVKNKDKNWISAPTRGINEVPQSSLADDNHEVHSFQYESPPDEFTAETAGFCNASSNESCVDFQAPATLANFQENISFNAFPLGDVTGTALSATRSQDAHVHLYTGISWQSDKAFSAGVTTGFSKGRSTGALLYSDLDGNGVGDWITRPGTAGGQNNFLVQGGFNTTPVASDYADKLRNSLVYGDQKNQNRSIGVQIFPDGENSIGFNRAVGKATTERYTMDINGDGWADVADRGVTHFAQPRWVPAQNSIGKVLEIDYGTSSENTPVPFHTAGQSASTLEAPKIPEPVDDINSSTSIVASWKAPIGGSSVTASFNPTPSAIPRCIASTEQSSDFQLAISRKSNAAVLPNESMVWYFEVPSQGAQANVLTCTISSTPVELTIQNINAGDLVLFELRRAQNTSSEFVIPVRPTISSTPYSEAAVGNLRSHPGASNQSDISLKDGLSNVGSSWTVPQCAAATPCPTMESIATEGAISSSNRLSENATVSLLINGVTDPTRTCILQGNIINQTCSLEFADLQNDVAAGDKIEISISSKGKIDLSKLNIDPVTLTYTTQSIVDGLQVASTTEKALSPKVEIFDVFQNGQSSQFQLAATPADSIQLASTFTFEGTIATPPTNIANLSLKSASASGVGTDWNSEFSIPLFNCDNFDGTHRLDFIPQCTTALPIEIPIPVSINSSVVAELAFKHPDIAIRNAFVTPTTGTEQGNDIPPVVTLSNYRFRPSRIGNNWSVFSSNSDSLEDLTFDEIHSLPTVQISQSDIDNLANACNDAAQIENCEQNPISTDLKQAANDLIRVSQLLPIGRSIKGNTCNINSDFALSSQDSSVCFTNTSWFVGEPNAQSPINPVPAPEFNAQATYSGTNASRPYSTISKRGETLQDAFSISAGVSLSAGESTHVGRTEFFDINGDRWPDPHVAAGGSTGSVNGIDNCQITLPFGGRISGNLNNLTENSNALCLPGTRQTEGVNATVGMAGNFPRGQGGKAAVQGNIPQGSNDTSQITSEKGSMGGFGANASGNASVSTLTRDFNDINGDGLIDVYRPARGSLAVTINFGAAGFKSINTMVVNSASLVGEDLGCGLAVGASYNRGVYDFAGGVNLNSNNTQSQTMLLDYDGDGLQDLITTGKNLNISGISDLLSIDNATRLIQDCLNIKSNVSITLQRNLGDRFERSLISLPTGSSTQVSLGANSGRGAGVYTSIPIPIPFTPLSIIINPGADVSEGYGAQEFSIQDADGFGLPDLIRSTGANLTTNTNILERTPVNLLTRVQSPLGGSIRLKYKKDAPTTDKPYAKWVLSGVMTNDQTTGDGEDRRLTKFEYKYGRQDRSERQFLGYEQVLEVHILPEENRKFKYADLAHLDCNENIVRAIDRRFANRSIYAQGILVEERIGRISSDCKDVPIRQSNIRTRNRYAQFNEQNTAFLPLVTANQDKFNTEALVNREPSTEQPLLHGRQHVFLAETLTELAEPFLPTDQIECPLRVSTLQQVSSYDIDGNVLEYKDFGRGIISPDNCEDDASPFLAASLANDLDSSDNLVAKINYAKASALPSAANSCSSSFAYIKNRPASIEVADTNGNWLRKRSATYKSEACLLDRISVHYKEILEGTDNIVSSDKISTTSISYDSEDENDLPFFGNIIQVVSAKPDPKYQLLPNGQHEGSSISKIEYDSFVATHPITVTDGFNLKSTFAYDLRFGTPVCVSDPNGRATFTELDGVGRTLRIWFPYYQTQLSQRNTVNLHAVETMPQFPHTRYDNRFTLAEDTAYLGWHNDHNWANVDCNNTQASKPIPSTWWPTSVDHGTEIPASYKSNLVALNIAFQSVSKSDDANYLPVIVTSYPDNKSSAALTRRLNLDLGGVAAYNVSKTAGVSSYDWIDTSVFIDGTGRQIQTRSEARLSDKNLIGRPTSTRDIFTVSGRTTYDGLGRVNGIFYPVAANQSDEPLPPSSFWSAIAGDREFKEATTNIFDHLDRVRETRLPYCDPNVEGISIDLTKATQAVHPEPNTTCDAATDGIKITKNFAVIDTAAETELPPLVLEPTRFVEAYDKTTSELLDTFGKKTSNAQTGFTVLSSLNADSNGNQTRVLTDARGLTIEVQECHAFPADNNFKAGGESPKPVSCQFSSSTAQNSDIATSSDSWIDTKLSKYHKEVPAPTVPASIWKTRYAYDPVMQIVAVKKAVPDASGDGEIEDIDVALTISTYDERGLRIQILNSDTGLVESRYDNASNLVEKITPNLRVQKIKDSNDTPLSIKHFYRQNRLEHISHTNYGYESNVLYCFVDPLFLESAYDDPAANEPNELTLPFQTDYPQLCKETFANEYQARSDNGSDAEKATDFAQRATYAKRFHQMGRPVRVVLGDIAMAEKTGKRNKLMRYESRRYGPLGELTRQDRKLTHADGHESQYVTLMRYDHLNRMRQMAFPDGEVINYNYDVGGQVRGIDWIRTHRRSALSASAKSDDGDIDSELFTYKGTYLEDQVYDEFGKIVGKKLGNGVCTYQLYGKSSRRLISIESYRSIRFNDDFSIGIPIGITDWNCNEQAHTQKLAYRYDEVGNITQITDLAAPRRRDRDCGADIPCNTSLPDPAGGWQQQRYFYDSLHRLVRAEGNLYPEVGPSLSLDTDLDENGERTWNPPGSDSNNSNVQAPGRNSYQLDMRYDELHRITRKKQTDHWQSYGKNNKKAANSYDWKYEYGNRTEPYALSGSEHTPTHAPTNIGDSALNYDYNGNLIAYVKSKATDKNQSHIDRRLYWDDNNQLRLVTDSGARKGHYLYDEAGVRLVKRTADYENHYVNEYFVSSNRGNGRATKQIMAGDDRIATRVSNYRVGSVRADETPETYFYQSNHLNSSGVITDYRGNTYQHIAYFPTGEVWVEQPDESELIPYRFTGKEIDRETGYQYFGARYYDPRLSIWPSADRIVDQYLDGNMANGVYEPKNLSLYSYGWNNSVRYFDADGNGVWTKLAKFVIKGGDLAATFSDVTKSAAVIVSPTSTPIQKIGAALSIASEVAPVSIGDVKAGWKYGKKAIAARKNKNKAKNVAKPGSYRPDRTLPRDRHGNPVPDTNAPHTQLGKKKGRKGDYTQAREFDAEGNPVRDIDFTDHGRSTVHPNPHQHRYVPNDTGGTRKRLKDAEPL